MNNIKIGIDLDNTFWNLGEATVELFNLRYRQKLNYKTCNIYDLDVIFNKIISGSGDYIEDLYYEAFNLVNPYKDAIEIVNKMKENGFEIYFCTSSTIREIVAKDSRLHELFDWYNIQNLITIDNKSLLNLDIVVDDLPKNLNSSLGILYEQPYNKHCTEYNMVNNWNDVWETVKLYAKLKGISEVDG